MKVVLLLVVLLAIGTNGFELCDEAEYCSGVSVFCPSDARPEEFCSGESVFCPPDTRPEEFCRGPCPQVVEVYLPKVVTCPTSIGMCDPEGREEVKRTSTNVRQLDMHDACVIICGMLFMGCYLYALFFTDESSRKLDPAPYIRIALVNHNNPAPQSKQEVPVQPELEEEEEEEEEEDDEEEEPKVAETPLPENEEPSAED